MEACCNGCWASRQAPLVAAPCINVCTISPTSCSIYEAPYRGKPLVCMPLAADQFDGCAKVRAHACTAAAVPRWWHVAQPQTWGEVDVALGGPLPRWPQAVKGGWGLQFKKEELSPATAHRLTARLEQASAEGSPLAQRAAVVGAMLKAHSRPALELAAGG